MRSDRPLRVTCAMPYALGSMPSQRYRWEQWAPELERHGIRVALVPFSTPELERARAAGDGALAARLALRRVPAWLRELARHSNADALVVHRNAALLGSPAVELILEHQARSFIFDFDDAIYLPREWGDSRLKRALRADWRVGLLARRASFVTVGSRELRDYASRFTSRCEVWPTTMSLRHYSRREVPPSSKRLPVIGWTGSRSTVQYLLPLLPVLRELARLEPFELLVIGATVDLSGLRGECVPWTVANEVAQIQRIDIGLMPHPDTPWTRGKCATKALQYLAVGSPAVVSDVGMSAEAVPDGNCGYVVRGDAWLAPLLALLRDPAKRLCMGAAGRVHVEQHYSAEACVPRFARRIREIVASERHKATVFG